MIEKTRAYAFLREKLTPEDLKTFLSLIQSPGWTNLEMRRQTAQYLVGEGLCAKSEAGQVAYQIRPEDLGKNLMYPDDGRLYELWSEHVGSIWMEILHREVCQSSLLIRTLTGVPISLREKFLVGLSKETRVLI